MHAYILNGGEIEPRAKFVSDLITPYTELIHVVTEKSSITIKQIQDLAGPLAISPRLPRIVWIEEANLMTIPAQNALLKMLEEPPEDTIFYLSCASHSSLLPTILSRSHTIMLEKNHAPKDPTILLDLKAIMSMSAGDRISSIVKRDRSESIIWISQIEQSLRDKLREQNLTPNGAKMLAGIAKLALSAHTQLAANCSSRFDDPKLLSHTTSHQIPVLDYSVLACYNALCYSFLLLTIYIQDIGKLWPKVTTQQISKY
jgi:hypothetical protein